MGNKPPYLISKTKTDALSKLGYKARDKASGLEGVITSLSELYNGCLQFGIQPAGDGKTVPDSWSFDVQQVEILEHSLPQTWCKSHGPALGDKVKDKTSGDIGIVSRKYYTLNGCVSALMEIPGNYFKAPREVWNLVEKLTVLESAYHQPVENPTGAASTRTPKVM